MANSPVGQKNRPYNCRLSVRNGETSTNILVGQTVAFEITGDTDADVHLSNTAGATRATTLFAGVAVPVGTQVPSAAVPGEYFDVICGGFCQQTKFIRGTRAATTDAWPSLAALAIGDVLNIDTVNNAFVRSGAGAADKDFGGAIAAASFASTTTAASNAFTDQSANTAYTVYIKSLLRNLF